MARKLGRLSAEERQELAQCIFYARSSEQGVREFYETHPGAGGEEYRQSAIRKYYISSDYAGDIKETLSELRSEPENKHYVQRPDRIEALTELLGKVFARLKELEDTKELSTGVLKDLCTVAVKLLSELRLESEPYDQSSDETVSSPFDAMMAKTQALKDEIREEILKELQIDGAAN